MSEKQGRSVFNEYAEKYPGIWTFIKFGIVGVSNALVNYIVYLASLWVFRKLQCFGANDYLAAQVIAFIISVLWAFYFNKVFVFKKKDSSVGDVIKSLLKTYASYAFTGLVLSELLLLFWVKKVGLSELVAPVINILICTPINYYLNKLWAFKK